MGENGAGKSTLVGILAGFVRPDGGTVTLGEHELPLGDPLRCRAAGLELVHQHFTLAPGLTVGENLELARMGSAAGLRSGKIVVRAAEIASGLGWDLPLDRRAEELGVAARQRIEIIKALTGEARILILDEPTASLAPSEAAEVFRVLRRLAGEGRTVVLIAHKLTEVRAVADRATVLRAGRVVGSGAMPELDDAQLVRWMIGREESPEPPEVGESGGSILQLRGVSAPSGGHGPDLEDVSFAVGREIYGIGGVEGNGQGLLAEVLAGLVPCRGVTVWEDREQPLQGLRCGYVPEDRARDGVAAGLSIERNLLVGISSWAAPQGRIRETALRGFASETIERYGVRASGPGALAGSLSGGNAQKVVVARALESGRELVVAHNPTRGLDLGARETIHAALHEVARLRPVVLLTSDLDELFALSSRTAFLSRGRLRESRDPALMAGWPDDDVADD